MKCWIPTEKTIWNLAIKCLLVPTDNNLALKEKTILQSLLKFSPRKAGRMKPRYIFWVFLFQVMNLLWAQEVPKVPLEYQESLSHASGKEKVDILNAISERALSEKWESAGYWATEALDLSSSLDYDNGMALSLLNLSLVSYQSGDFQKAYESGLRALEIWEKSGDKLMAGKCQRRLGNILSELHRHKESVVCFQKSIQSLRQVGATLEVASSMNNLGLWLWRYGDYPGALEYFQSALVIQREMGSPQDTALVLNNVGVVLYNWGRLEEALSSYYEAYQLREKLGEGNLSINLLNNIGKTYFDLEEHDRAKKIFMEALEKARSRDSVEGQAYSLNNLASCYIAEKDYGQALDSYRRSLELYTSLNHLGGMALNYNGMGKTFLDQGDLEQARLFFNSAISSARKGQLPVREAEALKNMGESYMNEDHASQALNYLEESRKICETISQNELLQQVNYSLSLAYRKSGNFEKSLDHFIQHTTQKEALFNLKTSGKLAELHTTFDLERKEKENALLRLEKEKHLVEIKRQKSVIYQVTVIGFFLLLTLFFLIRSNIQKKRVNQLMAESNRFISSQKVVLEEKNLSLQAALADVKTLSGLLPICSSCKKIRDDQGYWEQLEVYIDRHSNAQFSHSLCPQCIPKYYPKHMVQNIKENYQNSKT